MACTAYIACFISVLVARVSAFSVADCPANIPHDGSLRVHGNFCYTFDTHHSNTYPTAERACETRGGHLVVVRDAETQAFLATTLLNQFRYRGIVWIGFTDTKVEGHWEWVDGTPAHYTHWASGQPGIAGGFEDCAAMDLSKSSTGEWEDYICEGFLYFSQSHRFVCEYQIPSTVTAKPATTPLPTTTTVTTTTTVPTVTVPNHTNRPTTAHPISRCLQCGDYDNAIPCTEDELHNIQATSCGDPYLRYCMTDVYKISAQSNITINRRCVDEATCLKDYFFPDLLQTSYCQHLNGSSLPDIVACHLCCHGDACNTGLVPDPSTLYQMGS